MREAARAAKLPTKILDFRGFDSSRILSSRGEISGKPESTNLSRDNLQFKGLQGLLPLPVTPATDPGGHPLGHGRRWHS